MFECISVQSKALLRRTQQGRSSKGEHQPRSACHRAAEGATAAPDNSWAQILRLGFLLSVPINAVCNNNDINDLSLTKVLVIPFSLSEWLCCYLGVALWECAGAGGGCTALCSGVWSPPLAGASRSHSGGARRKNSGIGLVRQGREDKESFRGGGFLARSQRAQQVGHQGLALG